ncbi:MAG TPA: glycosyltransferase family 4 protein [Candidatus Paceibacterota bacterium]|nr:glycosyltransferase family 4 protein [Candidatus Paceibacterota bacterium]
MKLLIITQKIDKQDPVLGFFHRWIEEFSKHCEKLTVICLEKGENDFSEKAEPCSENSKEFSTTRVKVLSLGKEQGVSRFEYLKRFYTYIREEQDNYDSVFVHMNQEYVLLGALPWKTWGKKVFMWRNHPNGSILTDLAVYFSDRVFCTSSYSYTARFKKTEIMPVGIDTEFFKRDEEIRKKDNSILFLGRISPIKKPLLFIEALNILNKKNVDFNASIIGDPLPKDNKYFEEVKGKVSQYGLVNKVTFLKSVTNTEAKSIYNSHKIYVNLTPTGSMDKTIFEAMACDSLVLISNKSLFGKVEDRFLCREGDAEDLAKKLAIMIKEKDDSSDLRKYIENNHSLKKLAEVLLK